MPSHSVLKLSSLVCIIFPSVVLAKRGGGRVGGGSVSGGGGDGDDGGISPFFLEPLDAAIFAFCVIFGVFTAIQATQAGRNIYRRVSHRPPSITLPEYSVGPIFPTFLLLSTLMLTTYYVLYGVYWGVTNNQNAPLSDIPGFSDAYFNAWNVMAYLTDIFLVSGILALLSHRERVLVATSPVFRDIKMIFDAVLIVILLALGMGRVALSAVADTTEEIETGSKIYIAFTSFFFVTAVDIAVSSILLYVRARRSPVNDHKVRVDTYIESD